MATQTKELIKVEESFWKKGWRPAMAWVYVTIVIFDFLIAPIIMMVLFGQAQPPAVYHAWEPLTLMSGGFFHIAMGAIVGIGSYTRGVEKQKRVEFGIHSD